MSKIVILTGAGISAESGLGTFRDEGGLWAQHRIEDVATPEGFARDLDLVHEFYNARRAQSRAAQPNAAHYTLAKLQKEHRGDIVLVTQNVDNLHEAAGAQNVCHMHGFLDGALCSSCDTRWPAPLVMSKTQQCPSYNAQTTRPDIVWFSEMPYQMETIYHQLSEADLFVAIGTSGNVYPAAGFVQEATLSGADTLELNLEASATISQFAQAEFGKASEIVPNWVETILR